MSIGTVILGALFSGPEAKTSKAGKSYVAASVKVANGSESEFWYAMAFGDDAREALLDCAAGEKVALQGSPKFDVSTTVEGNTKVRRTLFIDAVLTARPKSRLRRPRGDGAPRLAAASIPEVLPAREVDNRGLDDDLPF